MKRISKVKYNGAALFSEFVLKKVNELVDSVNDTREIAILTSRQPQLKGLSDLSQRIRDLEYTFESKLAKDAKKIKELSKKVESLGGEEATPALYQERYEEGYRRGYEDAREDVRKEIIERLDGTKD